ncbi:MAG TPA: ABC transporter ATP-binding protein [Acidimicrobiales bacterium]|nr:ABC transporter ATP-binding protein [Acidimicrobiales bacterium]
MPAIDVENLEVRYGERVAVDGVSFSVEAGEVVALLGPNGAGKTTTVESIEGYRRPAAGRVRVLGLDPVADHSRLVPRLGVMLQRGGVYPVMSARRVLNLFAAYYAQPRSPNELLDLLGLSAVASTPFRRLSGGEQQRLMLALALIGRPEVCCLDEPTAGVDPAGRAAVREVIASLRDDGVAVLLTSHELDEVERLAERVVIIGKGRIVASGATGELGGGDEAVHFSVDGQFDRTALSQALGVAVLAEHGGRYRLEGAATPERVAALTAWLAGHHLTLTDLRVGRERLEDVFLRLVSEEQSR